MKINEIIESSISEEQIQTTAELIAKDCRPFLQQCSTTSPLWRGLGENDIDLIIKIATPRWRESTGMSEQVFRFVTNWFKENTGTRFRQEYTMFATSEYYHADGFGYARIVIPIGNFKFCWSPHYYKL